MPTLSKRLQTLLEQGLQQGVRQSLFSDAQVLLTLSETETVRAAVGSAQWFDIASLTKPLVTGPLLAQALSAAKLRLHDPLGALLPEAVGTAVSDRTIEHLLRHRGGLIAFSDWFRNADTPEAILNAVCATPTECRANQRTIYSDAGFILLAWVIARTYGQPIADIFKLKIATPLGLDCDYPPLAEHTRDQIATTGYSAARKRHLLGEVHDENAAVLGRFAGHAGLFADAQAVSKLARIWLDRTQLEHLAIAEDWRPLFITGSATQRALAWDRVDPPFSQAGSLAPRALYGHLGFTGTSVWVDPSSQTSIVLLTNRVACDSDGEAFRAWRPQFHDQIWSALGLSQTSQLN